MIFRTEVQITPLGLTVDHRTRFFAVGSCFADNISRHLDRARFRVSGNPFGTMFNPASVALCLDRLLDGTPYLEQELSTDGGLWFSHDHHGSLAAHSPSEALAQINNALAEGSQALAGADVVIVTLGTAWLYLRQGRVVANCHKRPAAEFVRRRMDVDQIVVRLTEVFDRLSGKQIILTVSPVRHLKDGLAENSLSKATLLVAAHRLAAADGRIHYFPAWEIVMDDLRDYRFYAPDMVHPSQQAIDYIWEKFSAAIMSPATLEVARQVESLVAAAAHRPLNPDAPAHNIFRQGMLARCLDLAAAHPEIDLGAEIRYFGG